MLGDKDEVKPLKLIYIDVLGRFENSRAAAALLERVMTDPDLEVRERSIESLKKHGSQQALAFLTRSLKNKDNQVVNHAGWALGLLGDPAAIPALIDAVVTKHRFQVPAGGAPGSMNAAFGSGGTGFQPGGRPKIVEQSFNNSQVLAALRALVPEGINFGYNPVAWKDWWAREQVDPDVNLRRDL
jgi:HEAT repeat protein